MNTQEIKITNAQTISINAKMQDKVVTPSLEQQTILPDENYNSLSKVVVNAVTLENKIVHPNRDTQIITPTESLGLSSVTVEPVSLEEKSIIPTKEVQVLNPSNEYVGFSQVTVEKIPEDYIIPEGNLDIRNNGDFDVTENATVNVNVQHNLQEKEARVTAPTNIFIHPDEEYDGLAFVNVIASVDTETKEVTPTKEVQTINRSDGKYIDSVTVNAIPDEYIIPSGEMKITENGSYDVTDKASVKVETSGADLSEYFGDITKSGQTNGTRHWVTAIKKLPALKNTIDMNYLYNQFEGTEIDFSELDFTIATTMAYMFQNCINLIELDLTSFDTSNIKSMAYMFSGCKNLKSVDLSTFDTSNVITMQEMFRYCGELLELDLSSFDTSNVTNMSGMFNTKSLTGVVGKITKIILGENFKTDKVITMASMFEKCANLEELDVSNFNTSLVKTFANMFLDCESLKALNLSNWNTSEATNISYMFSECESLTDLDLSSFNTEKVTNMQYLFNRCVALTNLNIGNFDFSLLTGKSDAYSMRSGFYNCSNLTNLIFGQNYGKGFTLTTNNSSIAKLDLSYSKLLTHDSLMSVINNLYDLNLTYDVANGGTLYTQQLVLGADNIAKLSEEELAVATNKGWSVS